MSGPCPSGWVAASAAEDCDDTNRNVFPGQKTFQLFSRGGGGYDYDCDGMTTKAITGVVVAVTTCAGLSKPECETSGIASQTLSCGGNGEVADCLWSVAKGGCTFDLASPDRTKGQVLCR